MDRRTYLRTVAGLVAGAAVPVAGCSTAVGSVPAPEFPDLDDGWTQFDERRETLFEDDVAGSTVEAKAHAVAYEDESLRREFARALGTLDHPASVLAASRVSASGDLERLLDADSGAVATVEKRARERFESRLAEVGIENVERTEADSVQVDTGETAEYVRYLADLSVEAATEGTVIGEADLDTVPVAGDLAIWKHDGSLLVAGAAYPAERLSETIERRGGDPDGIEADFDPAAYRQNVRAVITGIR
jgi:hypothetical protein